MDATAIRIISFALLVVAFILTRIHPYESKGQSNVYELATRNLYNTVPADYRFSNSLTQWLYSILVICYRIDESLNVMPVIRDWAYEHINATVEYDVEEAYTKFLKVVTDAKDLGVPPNFKVSREYDYHELPNNLKFSGYVDCLSLIADIDEILGEAV